MHPPGSAAGARRTPDVHSTRWTTNAGNPACPCSARQSVRPRDRQGPFGDAPVPPSLAGAPPRSVPRRSRRRSSSTTSSCPCRSSSVGAIAITALELGRRLGQPARQAAASRDRRAAAGRHDRRRDSPDLALGLGLDAGRPRPRAVPARLGRGRAHRPRARSSAGAAVLVRRERRPAARTQLYDRGPDARSTDIDIRRPASRRGSPRRSTSAPRCGGTLQFGDGRRRATASASPARRAATSPTSTPAWS